MHWKKQGPWPNPDPSLTKTLDFNRVYTDTGFEDPKFKDGSTDPTLLLVRVPGKYKLVYNKRPCAIIYLHWLYQINKDALVASLPFSVWSLPLFRTPNVKCKSNNFFTANNFFSTFYTGIEIPHNIGREKPQSQYADCRISYVCFFSVFM
jgi:hypothetical protein